LHRRHKQQHGQQNGLDAIGLNGQVIFRSGLADATNDANAHPCFTNPTALGYVVANR